MKTLIFLIAAGALPWVQAQAQAQSQDSCRAQSGATAPALVELYTSEGCSSCPPADRWSSTLRGRSDVVVAAFHVDYWDRLGWVDRFGSARHTARQMASMAYSGARFAYTPQVLRDGADWRAWPGRTPPAAARAAPLKLSLDRRGGQVTLVAETPPGVPATSLWWAWLEDDHVSTVKAGENEGATLRHDHVVRHYGERALAAGAQAWTLPPRERAGRLLVVVTDARGAPLQALAC